MRLKDGEGRGQTTDAVPHTRRRLAVAGAAALLTVPALMLAMHGTAVGSAVAAAIADPASILAARSPGARASGALAQTKLIQTKRRYARSGRGRHGPTERVLGQARTRPTGALPLGDVVNPAVGTLIDIPQGVFGGIDDGSLLSGSGVVTFGGTPVTGIGLIGGGSGGGTTPSQPGTPPVSAVPEPSTWLMTILGFFAAGIGLRRRRLTGATAASRRAAA